MITKEIVKEYYEKKCPYLAFLSVNEKYLLRTLRKILEENPDVLFGSEDEDGEERKSIMTRFVEDKKLLKEAQQIVKETFKDDPATLFIQEHKDYQEVSYLSMRYLSLIYKNVKRADTFDGSIDGAILENQEQIEENTRRLMNDPNVDVVLEGQITVDGLRARYDALIKKVDGLYLYELKGTNTVFKTNSIKKEYLYDLAFQYNVYQKANIPLKEIGYIYLNKDFKGSSYPLPDEELQYFFKFATSVNFPKLKQEVRLIDYIANAMYVDNKTPELTRLIMEIENIVEASPKQKLIYKCRGCDLKDACFKGLDENSILKLTASTAVGGNFNKSKELIEDYKVEHISEIEDDYVKSKFPILLPNGKKSYARLQIEYAKGNIHAKNAIELERMKKILNDDYPEYPLVFFDFETFMYPVPLVENARPWEQICCQYSMHVVHEGYNLDAHDFDKGVGGKITHYEFIGNPRRDKFKNPEPELLKTLKEQLEKENIDYKNRKLKLVVYNQSFEKTQFKRMSEKYPEYANFCYLMDDCIVDLMRVFSEGNWYQKCFNGRYSLKVTQPNLIKDEKVFKYYKNLSYDIKRTLNYKLGYIQNGGIALDVFQTLLRLIAKFYKDEENLHDLFIKSLLSYCKIDSWGTVILYDMLKNVVEDYEKGILDFDIDQEFLIRDKVKV